MTEDLNSALRGTPHAARYAGFAPRRVQCFARAPYRYLKPTEMLALLVAAMLAACGGNYGCGRGRSKVFDTPAPSPRAFTVVLRSYRGSREGLMSGARAMMVANPRFGKQAGGATPTYLAALDGEPAQAVSAYTFENSTASVKELLGMLSAIEERLNPKPDRDPAHPTLRLELWWVEGVHEKAMGLELPNPLILEERWANTLFVVGSEPYFAWSVEERRESRIWGIRVALLFEANQNRGTDSRVVDEGYLRSFTAAEDDGSFIYELKGHDEADVIASCAETSFAIDVHHHRYLNDEDLRSKTVEMQGGLAEDLVEKRSPSWVEVLEVKVPSDASLADRCQLWIDACRRKAQAAHLSARRSMVFDVGTSAIRGALLGERVVEGMLVPNVSLQRPTATNPRVETSRGETNFSAWLYAAVPKPPLPQP